MEADPVDEAWLAFGILPNGPDPGADATAEMSVEQKVGRAVLRLRLHLGWSQRDVERSSGVDQSTISRLECGLQRGLALWRLAAILRALRVGDIELLPRRAAVPPTAVELMLYGDRWERAGLAADRRMNGRRSRRPRAAPRLDQR